MRDKMSGFRLLVALPVVVLVTGTVGFMVLERLSFVDALYFTIVTISTVGYGDIYPTTFAGKIFSISLIVIGIGFFLAMVTRFTQMLVQRGQDRIRRRKLHMIVGVFFTEVGTELLNLFTRFDPEIGEIRQDCLLREECSHIEFTHLRKQLQRHGYAIDAGLMELNRLSDFLKERGDLLLRQLENPDLIEHESFTELLWAVVHLRDELVARGNFSALPEKDLAHLAGDARRAYGYLARLWVDYMQHLKSSYPYLFSLALRTNPFNENPSPIVR